jgi:hypothetical protein
MGSFWSKVLIALAAAFAVGQADTALAQNWGVPNIMLDVDANGTRIITPPYPFHRAVAVAATGRGLPSETHTFGSERD